MKLFILTLGLLLISQNSLLSIELKKGKLESEFSSRIQNLSQDEFSDLNEANKNNKSKSGGKKISALRAGLYSAILPGAGEYYAGNRSKARYFFAIEAIGWAGYIGYHFYSNMKKDDLIDFAATNANANLDGKDNDFLDLVGFYSSIDEYNKFGRVFDVERPYLDDTEEFHWKWQSDQDQAVYRHLKNRSREADRRSEFMLGLIVVNRVISIIDAIRVAKKSNRKLDEFSTNTNKPKYKFSIDPFNRKQQVSMSILTNF